MSILRGGHFHDIVKLKSRRKQRFGEGRCADMFRLWGKIIRDNHLIRDTVSVRSEDDTRTHKVLSALDEICAVFDLERPIWLDATISDFKERDKARFYQDSFIEAIDFDYLEIQVIEE